jgi:hypothetical protein
MRQLQQSLEDATAATELDPHRYSGAFIALRHALLERHTLLTLLNTYQGPRAVKVRAA